MFVDAPEFPETKDSSLVNSRASLVSTNSSNNKTFGPQEANSSIDVSSNTRKTSKAAAKTSKNKLDEAKVANVSRKNSKTLQNSNHSQPETPVVSENLLRTSGESKMRKPQLGRTKSPEELNNKKRGKLTSRSDSPLNLTNRSFSSSSTGTYDVGRGSYAAGVDNEEEDQESWNVQLEPGSDWNNEERNDGM